MYKCNGVRRKAFENIETECGWDNKVSKLEPPLEAIENGNRKPETLLERRMNVVMATATTIIILI